MRILFVTLFSLFTYSTAMAQAKPQVVATASMLLDMAQNIAGDHLEVKCIVPIGSDPHLHDPTPRDARLVANAQMVLKNALTFEGWLDELIRNSGTEAKIITVTEGISPIASDQYKNAKDPHAWMDVSLGLQYIKNIKNAFVELAPEHAASFEQNYANYKKQLEELDQFILDEIKKIPAEKRILITSHDAFQYYGRRYGIKLEAVIGTSTDAEVRTSDITRLNKVIKENKIPAVFVESTINPKLLQQLARDNDIQIGGELYADSIGDKDSPAPSYIEMMRHNTEMIVKALSRDISEVANTTQEETSGNRWILFGLVGLLFVGGFVMVFRRMNQV